MKPTNDLKSRFSGKPRGQIRPGEKAADGIPGRTPDRTYQITFVDKIIEELRAGKSVLTSRRFLIRFMTRMKTAGIEPLPVHVQCGEDLITIVPKSGLVFPPETVDMRSETRKHKNKYDSPEIG